MQDQDLYAWTVDEADAAQRWALTLHPVGGQTTTVTIVQVTFADNGVDVVGAKTLLTAHRHRHGSQARRRSPLSARRLTTLASPPERKATIRSIWRRRVRFLPRCESGTQRRSLDRYAFQPGQPNSTATWQTPMTGIAGH